MVLTETIWPAGLKIIPSLFRKSLPIPVLGTLGLMGDTRQALREDGAGPWGDSPRHQKLEILSQVALGSTGVLQRARGERRALEGSVGEKTLGGRQQVLLTPQPEVD